MRWLKTITRYRATHSSAPNFAYQLCTDRAKPQDVAELDLSSWLVAANGAEPIRAETLSAFAAAFAPCGFRPEAMFPCYGLAEATLLATSAPYLAGPRTCDVSAAALGNGSFTPDSGPRSRTVISSGTPAPGVEVRIVDPVSLEPCGPGQIGEVWLRGETIAAGYWASPEETGRTFGGRLPDGTGPYLRTGDLGCMHDGELYITGRIKDLIIIRGQNHYPHDIESTVAASHAALRSGGSAAFALEDAGAEALGIVQEVERGLHPGVEVLEAAIRDAVSRQHQLSIARLLLVRPGTVPKTSSGKVRRLFCREQLIAGDLVSIDAGGR
jgi:acyl-CoA synthetase (AMP-forming)/AMP-acid ligase II